MNYITIPTAREARRTLRREKAEWQKAALGLLVISAAVNAAQCAAIAAQSRRAMEWENKYSAAVAIEKDAVQAYGDLIRATERERQAREEQARAYEAVGAWEYIGECTITAYCPCEACCGRWSDGITASGLPAEPGVVAVDPEVIPLGATVVIDGQRYLAADTGAGVVGNSIDICQTTHESAAAFGVRRAGVWVIAEKEA